MLSFEVRLYFDTTVLIRVVDQVHNVHIAAASCYDYD